MRDLVIIAAAAFCLTGVYAPAGAQSTSADELNRQSSPPPATTTIVRSADSRMPDAVVTDFPGNMNAAPPAAAKVYPVCTARLQDNCQNRGEGGAPGRSRALPYWPGKPASER